jgi:REase_DpnII-MboI
MDKKTAVELVEVLITRGRTLDFCQEDLRERWRLNCRAVLERVFGRESRQVVEFARIDWVPGVFGEDKKIQQQRETEARRQGLRRSLTILESTLDEITQFWELDGLCMSSDPFRLIERLCETFHSVARQLRYRHGNRATLEVHDEYDVQDLIHALLLLDFDDVRPEEWTPSYAGASSRMDFLLKREQIVLEVKRTRKGLAAKQVGEQLIVDCQRYKGHPDCKMMVCFVYDPEGLVANPRGVESDLATAGGELPVRVFIRP